METKANRDRTAPSRRGVLAAAAVGVAAAPLAGCGDGGDSARAEVTTSEGDNVLGSPDAPVTIIEYASVTCPHCKAFHDQVFPELRARYIDTGKVRFVFRELPTPPAALATAGFLVARCAPDDKYFDVLDLLFDKQIPLVEAYQARTAREELLKIARPMGISEQQFNACLDNQAEIERIRQIGEEGFERYGVSGTPTFVIDGKTYGAMGLEQFVEIIDPLLPAEDS
jgi:protein-disulfide isomerase